MGNNGKCLAVLLACSAAGCSAPAPSLGEASPLGGLKPASALPSIKVDQHAEGPHGESDLRLEVSLSAAAEKLLADRHEQFILAVRYFADAKVGTRAQLNGVGQVDLGTEQLELVHGGPIHLKAPIITAAERALMNAPMEINVNVFSNRRTSSDNLLDCNFYQDYVELARRDGMKIKCSLLSEVSRAVDP